MGAPVTIVIPNWNGAALLEGLLEALRRQTLPPEQVIVVDNGSADESVAVAKNAGATVIELDKNTGFSHAVNCGIQAASTNWIVVLNNDVSPAPDWLSKLMDAAVTADAWFATGKLLDSQDRIDGTFDAISRGACSWRCGHGRPDSPLWDQARPIRFAPFTAALFRAGLFQHIGLLDENFESYLEDIDFGIRCAAAGLTGVYAPSAVAYHAGSATLGRWHPDTVRRIARNQLLIVAKHYPRNWILRYGWPVLVGQGLWGFVALRHGTALAYLRGKAEGLRRFREARGNSQDNLPAVIEQSEAEIRELQRLTGFDLYWRLYFALT
ncbi:MAG TPA: glycosyltransferase family 2 protein [Bryobacteraceae bacterium]|nr:glycosyltransferase family 2 protein [Bryobacteraceae bacterium]